MKEYMTNNELIDYLSSKGVIIENKGKVLQKIERYTYYSIVNSYKAIFKDKNGNYINNVTFDEIYSLFEFDKTLKNIILKNCLEIETVIKSIMANQISKIYGVKEYLKTSNWDNSIDNNIKVNLLDKINNEIDNEYLTSYVNIRKYPTILFVMAKIMEMNNAEQNQVAMYVVNSIE